MLELASNSPNPTTPSNHGRCWRTTCAYERGPRQGTFCEKINYRKTSNVEKLLQEMHFFVVYCTNHAKQTLFEEKRTCNKHAQTKTKKITSPCTTRIFMQISSLNEGTKKCKVAVNEHN
uniref:Uncharacterized protein n=1 Tax=Romanomermis culicivorax TaxID=13658 RepID=A0A915I5R0_ROMCU